LPSLTQAYTQGFVSSEGISTQGFEIGDSIDVTSGNLHVHAVGDTVGDVDNIVINFEEVRSTRLVLELKHWINVTTGVELSATLFKEHDMTGDSVTIDLMEQDSSYYERLDIGMFQVSCLVLSVEADSGDYCWQINHIQVSEDSEMGLDFALEVPLSETGDGSYHYVDDILNLETSSSTNYSITVDWVDIPTAFYPYVSLDMSGTNLTGAWIDITTTSNQLSFALNWTSGSLINLTSIDSIVESIEITILGNGGDVARLLIDSLVFSWVPVQFSQRYDFAVDYYTSLGISTLEFDDHLLSWDMGSIVIVDDGEFITRVRTTILEWSDDCIIVQQVATNKAGDKSYPVQISLWNDGFVHILSDAQLMFVSSIEPNVYSDSISLVENCTDLIVRDPIWAAMYSEFTGFGLLSIEGIDVTASIPEGWMSVSASSDDNIVLLPVLERSFETIGGFEVDKNFYSMMQEINAFGFIEHWSGVIESSDVAMWEGSFHTTYAIDEEFDALGAWIIDEAVSTTGLSSRSELTPQHGQLNVTLGCEESGVNETLVLRLNYVDFSPSQYPFLGFWTEGDGSLTLSIVLHFEDSHSRSVLQVTPSETTEQFVNLVALLGEGESSQIVSSISIWIFENQIDTDAQKALFIDRLSVWGLNDFELVQDASAIQAMAISSVAMVENGVLVVMTSSDTKNSELRLSYKYIKAANSTYYRILQWRAYVGYASTLRIAVKNSTATYNLECSSLPWAVVETDLADEEDEVVGDQIPNTVDEIEIILSTTQGIQGEVHIDWLRHVAPYVSQYTWDNFQDGSFNPLIDDGFMSLAYVPDPPDSGPRSTWTDTTPDHTTEVWSSYSADPGSFSNGGHLNLGHNELTYDYTTWTFGTLSRDVGWVNLHSDGTQYEQDCGTNQGGRYSQSFLLGSSESISSLQVYIRVVEDSGFVGDNIRWRIYSGTSSAPNTGSVLRSGSFDASSSYSWKTISFSSLSNGWYWISIQGNYFEPIIPDSEPEQGTDAPPDWVYSRPYWRYASPSGSSGMRWWTTGTDSNDFLVKLHKYQTISGSAVFSYGLRVNWHDASGDHYTALTVNDQTVNHAGADDVWITSTNSDVTNINPT
ncbi:MAG: hypothetical protein KAR03_10650, partial [Candidatus Thorarchaeota archaeon]|nr:hypothetical protein [Candidatus Thorarchaeota archaeon]